MTEQDAVDTDGSGTRESTDGADTDDTADESGGDVENANAGTVELPAPIAEVLPEETDAAVDVEDALVDAVEEGNAQASARWLALLVERVDTLEKRLDERGEEIDDLKSRLSRKQADFQNYKKRQKERMEQEKQRATEDLVERLLDVRDNLARALDQDEDADIRGGVETTLGQFDEQLERENVDRLEPEPGDEVDPQRHEALATIAADQPEDTIAEVHRPGYEMAEKVLRPAQVVVSDGSGHDSATDETDSDETDRT